MHVHAIYRIHPGDNRKNRPAFHDKLMAFQSFLLAWRRETGGRLTIAVDADAMPAPYLTLFDKYATEVRYLGGLGNSRSYVETLQWVKEEPEDDLVYFAEDDYLYLPEAFTELYAAAQQIPEADYFTLYDHPDRYTRTDDAWRLRERIFRGGTRHWRSVESTCMTYGARVNVLKKDLLLHRALCVGNAPRDRTIWRASQGIGRYFWKVPKRTLVGPMPSLCTHLDAPKMAPFVDWAQVAQQVKAQAVTL